MDSVDLRAMLAGTTASTIARGDPEPATASASRDSNAGTPAAQGDGSASPRVVCDRFNRPGVASVAGTARESDGTPVPFATVTLEEERLRSTISERTGCFFLATPQRKELTVVVRRIGFHEARQRVDLRADSTVFIDVKLLPIATTLNGVVVTAQRDEALAMTGFYDRMLERKKGIGDGWFITPEGIERRNESKVTSLMEAR